jgi:TonB family protein
MNRSPPVRQPRKGHAAQGDIMSSIERKLRSILQDLPVRALCLVAWACAVGAHAAQAQATAGTDNSVAKIDFASCAKPVYPKADMQAGHQGTVTVDFLVDENGRVKNSKVTASSGFMRLDKEAQTALGKCSFHPALENGKPVQSWAHVKYVWTLG